MHSVPGAPSDRFPAVSLNTLCLEPAPFDVLVAAAAQLGADALFADRQDIDRFGAARARRAAADAGLPVAGLTHRAFGFVDETTARRERDRLNETLGLARDLGAGIVCLTTGGRGDLSWPEAARRFVAAIAPCVEAARLAGVTLAIEPTSHLYADASIVHRLADTTALARRAGIDVAVDLFPCWIDADLEKALDEAAPLAALAQLSDHIPGDRALPCRAVPGDGAIPLDLIVSRLLRAGFTGLFDLEVLGPRLDGDREAALRRGLARVRASIAAALAPPDLPRTVVESVAP